MSTLGHGEHTGQQHQSDGFEDVSYDHWLGFSNLVACLYSPLLIIRICFILFRSLGVEDGSGYNRSYRTRVVNIVVGEIIHQVHTHVSLDQAGQDVGMQGNQSQSWKDGCVCHMKADAGNRRMWCSASRGRTRCLPDQDYPQKPVLCTSA
jgi:hypothetical protein